MVCLSPDVCKHNVIQGSGSQSLIFFTCHIWEWLLWLCSQRNNDRKHADTTQLDSFSKVCNNNYWLLSPPRTELRKPALHLIDSETTCRIGRESVNKDTGLPCRCHDSHYCSLYACKTRTVNRGHTRQFNHNFNFNCFRKILCINWHGKIHERVK